MEKLSVPYDAVPLKLCCSYPSKTLGKGGHNQVSPQGRQGWDLMGILKTSTVPKTEAKCCQLAQDSAT